MRVCRFAVLILLCTAPTPLRAQLSEKQLQKKVESYKLSEPTFLDALLKVAADFKVPMGIELVKTPSVLRPVNMSWRRTTVVRLLSGLTASERGYAMRVEGGVLHVFRSDVVNRRSNLLNIHIPKFIAPRTTARGAVGRLWSILNAKLAPPRPLPPGAPVGATSSGLENPSDRRFSLELRDTTARGVLDAVAASSEYRVWLVTFAPGGKALPSGFRRTVSPISAKTFPDANQPALEILHWGDRPY